MDIKKRWERDERPCFAFARLDLDDAHEVTRFIYRLLVGRYPQPFPGEFYPPGHEGALQLVFGKPYWKMAELMWEELLGRPLNKCSPWLDMTWDMEYIEPLCRDNAHKLEGIQARLRKVLEVHLRKRESKERNKPWEIEKWLLDDDMREFVNAQLKRVRFQIIAEISPLAELYVPDEFIRDYMWEEVFLVPEDFEAAIYADIVEFFRSDGDIATCNFCGFFIEPSGQQRGRLQNGKPIYHKECWAEKKKEYLKRYRKERLNSDPEFREKERQRARKHYREVSKKR